MDTRKKIKAGAEVSALLRQGRWAVVVGLFDPLTTTQAERLAAEKFDARDLFAIVLYDGGALLPLEARAQMVAALRSVAAVALSEQDEWRAWIPPDADLYVLEDETAERKRSADFVGFVLGRQETAELSERRS